MQGIGRDGYAGRFFRRRASFTTENGVHSSCLLVTPFVLGIAMMRAAACARAQTTGAHEAAMTYLAMRFLIRIRTFEYSQLVRPFPSQLILGLAPRAAINGR